MATDEPRLYVSRELVALTGAKRSQVENWARTGVLQPHVLSTGTGDFRLYTFEGLLACAIAVRLSRYHMPSPVIGRLVRYLVALAYEPSPNPKFLPMWRRFLNPRTRGKSTEVTLYCSPDGEASPWVYDKAPVLPKLKWDTFIAIAFGQVIRALEAQTGDHWRPAADVQGARRAPRKGR